MAPNPERRLLTLLRRRGLVRPSDLDALGIPRARLYDLLSKGLLAREGRGIYVASGHARSAHHPLALAAKRVPQAVVCLLTALRFHQLTTEEPREVWVALPEKARRPKVSDPALRVARFSGPALTEGVETHRIEGVSVRVYSAAKTVADCFKYRNKIGMGVAVEALREFARRGSGTRDLARFARICRVERVMLPYLDAGKLAASLERRRRVAVTAQLDRVHGADAEASRVPPDLRVLQEISLATKRW